MEASGSRELSRVSVGEDDMSSSSFVVSAETPWESVGKGVRRQILGHGPDLMMVRVDFSQGAVGAIHHHPHRQVTYVAAGTFEVRVGDHARPLSVGDCFFAQADVSHGVVALTEGTLIDVFTPARTEFLGTT
jgi:quercetin dioxygenase-like cupin family protein